MWLDSPFARPVGSFKHPVPLVGVDPDDTPDVTVCFRHEWLPYIVGALQQLILQSTWDTTDPDALNVAQGQAQLLVAMFIQGCSDMFDVRQNVENPCTLEKTTDGDTWEAWANLQLCAPRLRIGKGFALQFFDGSSWVDMPGQGDERTDGHADPPWPTGTVPTGQTGNCLAAENIVAFFSSSLTQIRSGLDAGIAVSLIMSGIAGAAAGFIAPAIFAAAGLAVGAAAAALGVAGIDDMLSDDTLDKLKCAISCHANADGSITATEYNLIFAKVGATITGLKKDIIQSWLDGFGPVGLTRQGKASGITSGTCTCDCADVTICYVNGSGSTDITLGVPFVMTSTLNGNGSQAVWFTVDHNVNFKITGETGFTQAFGVGQIVYAYNHGTVSPCDYNFTLAGTIGYGNVVTGLPASTDPCSTFVCFSSTAFTLNVTME